MYRPTTSMSPTWSKPRPAHTGGIAGLIDVTTLSASSVRHKLFVPEKIHPFGVRATPCL
jgi:hypothetical protein